MTKLARAQRWFVLLCFLLLVWSVFSPKLFAQSGNARLTAPQIERLESLVFIMTNRLSRVNDRLNAINGRVSDRANANTLWQNATITPALVAECYERIETNNQILPTLAAETNAVLRSNSAQVAWPAIVQKYRQVETGLQTCKTNIAEGINVLSNPDNNCLYAPREIRLSPVCGWDEEAQTEIAIPTSVTGSSSSSSIPSN